MTQWLSAADFADAAGISPQAARKAMRRSFRGVRWRDSGLTVRYRHGAGGRSGMRLEVDLASADELADLLNYQADHGNRLVLQ